MLVDYTNQTAVLNFNEMAELQEKLQQAAEEAHILQSQDYFDSVISLAGTLGIDIDVSQFGAIDTMQSDKELDTGLPDPKPTGPLNRDLDEQ